MASHWRIEGFDAARDDWRKNGSPLPDATLVSVVNGWRGTVERKGLPLETVMDDAGNFVVRVMGTNTIVSGFADFHRETIHVYRIEGV